MVMMDTKMLDKKYHVEEETGFLYRYVRSETEYFRPHYHNYYEIFLIMRGTLCHFVNNCKEQLSQGDLVFIRDRDIHDYYKIADESFHLINIAFTKETFMEMKDFLGEAFPLERLLRLETPPHIRLTQTDTQKLLYNAAAVNDVKDSQMRKLRMRVLLTEIFSKYFMDYSEPPSEVPLWLELLYEKMKMPQNFTEGIEKMCELSHRSREHIARCMKKYYGVTPLQYINELKLNYAANLLRSSNLSVTEICYECGFQNLSWFYSLFHEYYDMPPSKYKKSLHAKK